MELKGKCLHKALMDASILNIYTLYMNLYILFVVEDGPLSS